MVAMERGKYYLAASSRLEQAAREFPCETPEEVRAPPDDVDIVAFQCRNPVHRAHYELYQSIDAPNAGATAPCWSTRPAV